MDIEEAYSQKDQLDEHAILDESWIKKIFLILDKQMDTIFDKNKLIIMNFVSSILQKHGNYFNTTIWNNILYVISKAGLSKNVNCVNQGFKNLKLIVGDYVTRMSDGNFVNLKKCGDEDIRTIITLIETIYEFADNPTNNINNRLTTRHVLEHLRANF